MANYADEVNLLQTIGEEDNQLDRSLVSVPPSSPSTSSSYPADEATQTQLVADDEANAEDTDNADEVNSNLLQTIGEEDNQLDRSSVSVPPSIPSTSSSYPADEATQTQLVADDEANTEDTDYADEVNSNLLQPIGEEDNQLDRSSVSVPPSSPSTSSSYPADEATQTQLVADDEANTEDTDSDEESLDADVGDDRGSCSEDSDHESEEESAEESGAEESTLHRQAPQSFVLQESEKWLAYENMKEETVEKIKKLEEERHTVDLWSCGPEWGRKRRRRQVTVAPPYVVYMLPDAEIMEDWRLVRKLLERND